MPHQTQHFEQLVRVERGEARTLADLDAVILMEFDAATEPLRNLPLGEELTSRMTVIALPFCQRLKANGHEWPDALALLRRTFQHNPPKVSK